MLKLALVVVALLAFPAAAQAQHQWPEGSVGEQPLTRGSGCLSWPAPARPPCRYLRGRSRP